MRRRRALTLLELVLTMALAGILLAVTMVSFRAPNGRAGSRALAEQVAESFRAARNQAQVEQSPVALVIPIQSGKVCSQSLAILRGQENPYFNYVHNYGREFSTSVLFVGTYPSTTPWNKDPVVTGHSNYWQVPLAASPANPLQSWLGGSQSNYTFVFSPDGGVHGNDLPHLGQDYAVVVSQGVQATPTTVPGTGLPVTTPPPYYALTQASQPYTVLISPLGSVRVVPGLADATGGVTLSPSNLPTSNAAAAPALTSEPVVNPSLTRLTFNPEGSAGPGLGVAATLDPSRQVQVNVQASVTSSDDLYCNIVCSGIRPSSGGSVPSGAFCTPGSKRMQYIPPAGGFFVTGSWFTSWQWNPPPQALPGDVFTFEATVTTRRGGSANSAALASASKKLQVYSKGKIYFGAEDPYTHKYEILSVRADGTDLNHVTHNEASTAQLYPAATRDGNKLLFAGVEPFVSADLFALSRTGGLSTRITVDNKPALHSHFSDDSAVGAFERTESFSASDYQLWCFDPNSLWPPSVAKVFDPSPSLALGCTSPALSDKLDFVVAGPPAGSTRRCDAARRIAFESDCKDSGKRAIYTANFCNPGTPKDPALMNLRRQSDGGPANILNDRGDRSPAWHPNCKFIAFQSDRSGHTLVYKIDFSENGHETGPDNAVCLTPGMNNAREPYFSPDGTALCFLSNDPPSNQWDIYIIDIDPATGNAVPGTMRKLGLPNYTPFTGGFPNMNRPTWTQ